LHGIELVLVSAAGGPLATILHAGPLNGRPPSDSVNAEDPVHGGANWLQRRRRRDTWDALPCCELLEALLAVLAGLSGAGAEEAGRRSDDDGGRAADERSAVGRAEGPRTHCGPEEAAGAHSGGD